ncbi:MAG: cupin domain-containing protein, partial [Gammaproteobacteria bacterium]|nr:cupin domain-containing protein [Gammaproteobacteria bacterium]
GTYEATSSEIAMKAFQPMVVHIPKGKEKPEAMSSHGGEEFLYVLQGSILFSMNPYSPTVLEQGDSVHFDSLMLHGFVAVGDEDAWLLSVCLFDKKLNQRPSAEFPDDPSGNSEGQGKS